VHLTLTLRVEPATELGYLLHKHPERVHHIDVPFGTARVLYPEAADRTCTTALVVDVNPVALSLTARARLRDVLEHLFVLLPVLDDDKHYWVGAEAAVIDAAAARGVDAGIYRGATTTGCR